MLGARIFASGLPQGNTVIRNTTLILACIATSGCVLLDGAFDTQCRLKNPLTPEDKAIMGKPYVFPFELTYSVNGRVTTLGDRMECKVTGRSFDLNCNGYLDWQQKILRSEAMADGSIVLATPRREASVDFHALTCQALLSGNQPLASYFIESREGDAFEELDARTLQRQYGIEVLHYQVGPLLKPGE